jgi:hypothetical protein
MIPVAILMARRCDQKSRVAVERCHWVSRDANVLMMGQRVHADTKYRSIFVEIAQEIEPLSSVEPAPSTSACSGSITLRVVCRIALRRPSSSQRSVHTQASGSFQ